MLLFLIQFTQQLNFISTFFSRNSGFCNCVSFTLLWIYSFFFLFTYKIHLFYVRLFFSNFQFSFNFCFSFYIFFLLLYASKIEAIFQSRNRIESKLANKHTHNKVQKLQQQQQIKIKQNNSNAL